MDRHTLLAQSSRNEGLPPITNFSKVSIDAVSESANHLWWLARKLRLFATHNFYDIIAHHYSDFLHKLCWTCEAHTRAVNFT